MAQDLGETKFHSGGEREASGRQLGECIGEYEEQSCGWGDGPRDAGRFGVGGG